MKILKYIFFLILIGIIGFGIYVAVQPNDYNVSRTKTINAPAAFIFNNINDYKNWEEWGPWYDDDSTIVATYAEKTSGVGASYSWTSKDGPGSMKTISLTPNKSIEQTMQFGDYEPNDVNWTFNETNKGTDVTWIMKADKTAFTFKIFAALSGGMDNMLGTMLDNGLNNIDEVITKQYKAKMEAQNAFKLSDVKQIKLSAQKFIGYKQTGSTEMDQEEMTKLFMEFMPKAGAYAMSKLSPEDFIPGTYYTKWDEATKEAEFYIGVLLKKNVAPGDQMTSFNIPSGNGLKIEKFGNYGSGDYEAHIAIGKYMEDNKIEMKGTSIWELYVNDPTTVKPEDIQTDIYYPVK